MTKAIIFDFDGVILNSVPIKTTAFARLFEPFGKDVVDQFVKYHEANGGVSRFVKFRYFYERIIHQPLSVARSEVLGLQFHALVFDEILKASLISGVSEFLEKYKSIYRMFIASGTPENELVEIVQLRGLHKYFEEVCGSPPNKTEILHGILKRHALEANKTIMVGDAMTDYEAAISNGVSFIGVDINGKDSFPSGTLVISDLSKLASLI